MRTKVAEVQAALGEPSALADAIRTLYDRFRIQRRNWEAEKQELRNYIFATDTTKTSNASLPWKNKTTIPKLTQIRDNLHANYLTAMFSTDYWFRWEANDKDGATKVKRKAIEAYMRNKMQIGDFYKTMSQLLLDYIDFGNCIADVEFVKETHDDPVTKDEIVDYIGPKLVRYNPMDVVFNLDAVDFNHSPKITRVIRTIAELDEDVKSVGGLKYNPEAWARVKEIRTKLGSFNQHDLHKAIAYRIDGFGDLTTYYGSQYIELLEFEGSIYDTNTGTTKENRLITVADRSIILRDVPIDTWLGQSTKTHVGWRERPGNLMAMGPLDNLVGMQYRIDHLENLKADIFDLIAHPVQVVKGFVKDYTWEPGAKIFVGEEGTVELLRPDVTALNADTQIAKLEQQMEEMAGAPKQALGFRTPGEKTAYEVQSLENAASRIFQIKIAQFESYFVEPIMNIMLEVSRRNMDALDTIKVIDDDIGVEEFMKVNRDDITARGRLRPIGSRHLAMRNQFIQNFNALSSSPIFQDPLVKANFSTQKISAMIEDLLQLDRYDLVRPYVRFEEELQAAQLQQSLQQQVQQAPQVPGQPPNVPSVMAPTPVEPNKQGVPPSNVPQG